MSQDLLLQHIIEIKESQTRTQTIVENLQRELLGNGQPGRMSKAEDAIQELQSNRQFRSGMLYSISVGVSVFFSALINYGSFLWQHLVTLISPKH